MKCKNVNVKMHNKLFSIINKIEKTFTTQTKICKISLESQQKTLTNNNLTLKRVKFLVKYLLFLFLFSSPLFAIESSTSVLKIIDSGLQSWIPTVKSACLWVFTALTLINWVWSFGLMALSGLGIVFNAYYFILFLIEFSPSNAFF